MARFIKLTPFLSPHRTVWVNSDHISSMFRDTFGSAAITVLRIDNNLDKDDPAAWVEETVEEILKLMAEAGDM